MYYIYYGQSLYIKVQSFANFCLKFHEFSKIFQILSFPGNALGILKPNFYKIRFSDFIPSAYKCTYQPKCTYRALIVHLFILNEKPEPSYYFCLPSVLESQLTQIIIRLSTAPVAEKSEVIKTYTVPFETVRKSKRHKRS